ncbi:hypothetical protein ABZ481_19505 [Micromonospora aurantiaca]
MRDRWGTAAQIAHRLGRDITAKTVHDWLTRAADPKDRLYGLLDRRNLPGRGRGATYVDLLQAAPVERMTRTSTRGAHRQLDVAVVAA